MNAYLKKTDNNIEIKKRKKSMFKYFLFNIHTPCFFILTSYKPDILT